MAFLLFVVGHSGSPSHVDSVAFNKQYSCCKFFFYRNTKNKLAAYFHETCKSLFTNWQS